MWNWVRYTPWLSTAPLAVALSFYSPWLGLLCAVLFGLGLKTSLRLLGPCAAITHLLADCAICWSTSGPRFVSTF